MFRVFKEVSEAHYVRNAVHTQETRRRGHKHTDRIMANTQPAGKLFIVPLCLCFGANLCTVVLIPLTMYVKECSAYMGTLELSSFYLSNLTVTPLC